MQAPVIMPNSIDLSFVLFPHTLPLHVCSPYNAVCVLQDAMQSMIGVLDAEPDPQAAFNLVLCTYALGDKEMMKQAFSKLVEVSMLCLDIDSDDSGNGKLLPV